MKVLPSSILFVLLIGLFSSSHGKRCPRYPIKVTIPYGTSLVVESHPLRLEGIMSIAMLTNINSKDGLVYNIVGYHKGMTCVAYLALGQLALNGERIVAMNEQMGSVLSIPDRSDILDEYNWVHKTIQSKDKYLLSFDDSCKDAIEEEIFWDRSRRSQFMYALVPSNNKWELELENASSSQSFANIALPSEEDTSSFLVAPVREMKLASVIIQMDRVPPSLAPKVKRHVPRALVRYGGTVTFSFTPQTPTAALVIGMYNAYIPKFAVIYNIVGHHNGKLCVANFWTRTPTQAIIQTPESMYEPFYDMNGRGVHEINNLMEDFSRLPLRIIRPTLPTGTFDSFQPTGFLGDCKHDGDYQWDQPGREYKIKMYPNGSRWNMLLVGSTDEEQLADFSLPATEETYGFTAFPQHGMELHSMRMTPAPEDQEES